MQSQKIVERTRGTLLLSPLLLILGSALTVAEATSEGFVVTESFTDKLVRVTPAGVRTEIFSFAPGTIPVDVNVDSNGDFIISERDSNTLSRVTPAGVRTEIFSFPQGVDAWPHWVAIDSNGDFIVPLALADKLFRVTPTGVGTEIFSFAVGSYPTGLTIDSNGDFIVAESDADKLSRITPAGVRTEIFSFAGGTQPGGMAIVFLPDVFGCINFKGAPLANSRVVLKQKGEPNQITTTATNSETQS